MPRYEESVNLKNLAQDLIQKHHDPLKILKIAYEFRDEAAVSNGKVIAGKCIRVDDRNYTLHGYDIIIEIARDVWDEATSQFQIAVLDHELTHVGIRFEETGEEQRDAKTDRIKTFIRMHDIEEFASVLERYGEYHASLRAFLEAFARRKSKEEEDGLS